MPIKKQASTVGGKITSSGLSGKHTQIIREAIDEVMSEYEKDNTSIFTESESKVYLFRSISRKLKNWKRSQKCMVPECSQRSIKRSHAIPKGMSLAAIAEEGLLLTPEFDKAGELILKPIGLSTASTFPGFCSHHERLFHEFENHKKLETEPHLYLQTYRAACREVTRSTFAIKHSEWVITSYVAERDKRLLKRIKAKAMAKGLPADFSYTSLSISNDGLVDWASSRLSGVRDLSLHVQLQILPALNKAVFGGCDDDIFVFALQIDLEIPVALSGCAPFFINDNNVSTSVYLLINVVPQVNQTLLIFAGDIANKAYIQFYISEWSLNIFSLLSMIESWMVNGTDQWYLKPSVWHKLAQGRQAQILNAMLESEQHIAQEYTFSIFDGIRSSLLVKLTEKLRPGKDGASWRLIESQRNKMI